MVLPYDLHLEPSRTDQGPQHTHHIPPHTHHIPQLMVFWSIFPLHATYFHHFSKKCSPPSVGSTFLKIDPQHFAHKNPLLGPNVYSLDPKSVVTAGYLLILVVCRDPWDTQKTLAFTLRFEFRADANGPGPPTGTLHPPYPSNLASATSFSSIFHLSVTFWIDFG